MKDIERIFSNRIEQDLVKRLLNYYKKVKQNFFLGRYEPSQLNSAKFVEVTFRILEYITRGNYTPWDKDIKINALMQYLENLPKDKYTNSIRLHIPRVLRVIYDIRSKRGVTHASEIDPNFMDATFVVAACDWVLAEFIHLFYTGDPNDAQKIISRITERKVPIIEEFGEDLKVLNPDLSVADKILLILYKRYPNYVSTNDLKRWIKTKSFSHIPTVLCQLDNDAKIHRKGKENIITKRGILHVEKKIIKQDILI